MTNCLAVGIFSLRRNDAGVFSATRSEFITMKREFMDEVSDRKKIKEDLIKFTGSEVKGLFYERLLTRKYAENLGYYFVFQISAIVYAMDNVDVLKGLMDKEVWTKEVLQYGLIGRSVQYTEWNRIMSILATVDVAKSGMDFFGMSEEEVFYTYMSRVKGITLSSRELKKLEEIHIGDGSLLTWVLENKGNILYHTGGLLTPASILTTGIHSNRVLEIGLPEGTLRHLSKKERLGLIKDPDTYRESLLELKEEIWESFVEFSFEKKGKELPSNWKDELLNLDDLKWCLTHHTKLMKGVRVSLGEADNMEVEIPGILILREKEIQGSWAEVMDEVLPGIKKDILKYMDSKNSYLPEGEFEVPSNWNQILTTKGLVEEGLAMDHCAGSYVSKCREGISFLYHVDVEEDPRGYTVEVKLNDQGKPKVVEVKGYSNLIPHKEEIYNTLLLELNK